MEIKIENGIEEVFFDAEEIEEAKIFFVICPRCEEKIEERTFDALLGERQHDCGLHFFIS